MCADKSANEPKRPSQYVRVYLDAKSRQTIAEAAALRGVSISEFVRTVAVSQARRDLSGSHECNITLTADEQLVFWNALNERPTMTRVQRRLGALIRSEC
jgi:uncharacterized protein (DUF1778 family)